MTFPRLNIPAIRRRGFVNDLALTAALAGVSLGTGLVILAF